MPLRRKMTASGRSKGLFIMLRHDMMDSPAWLALSPTARCVWLEVMRRFNGMNNGSIPLSCRDVSRRLGISKDTAVKAFNALMTAGFIRVGKSSSFDLKTKTSRLWILTHESHNGRSPTADWRRWPDKNHGTDPRTPQSDSEDGDLVTE